MAKKIIFKGAGTALITPMNETGVDYEAMGKLIDWQISQGIDALIILGTTGESSTLNDAEHKEVLSFCKNRAAGRVPLIAGTGSNDTAYAIQMTKHAAQLGYDAALVVTPYYNKTTQKGLIAHYTAIADQGGIPLILYNVPSRTGVNIEPATYAVLAQHPMIAGIKEASGNVAKMVETSALVGDKVAIYSGNDDEIVPIIACGGKGVISVLSNVVPADTSKMCHLALEGNIPEAMKLQKKYLNLIHSLFSQVNPIPVKAAMAALGFCEDRLRLPLVPMEEPQKEKMLACMKEVGLDV